MVSFSQKFFVSLVSIAAIGCKSKNTEKPLTHMPEASSQWKVQQLSPPPRIDMPVKEGTAPLVYIVETPAKGRVGRWCTGRCGSS